MVTDNAVMCVPVRSGHVVDPQLYSILLRYSLKLLGTCQEHVRNPLLIAVTCSAWDINIGQTLSGTCQEHYTVYPWSLTQQNHIFLFLHVLIHYLKF